MGGMAMHRGTTNRVGAVERRSWLMGAMLWLTLVTVGCTQATPAAPTTGLGPTGSGASSQSDRPHVTKTLRLGSIKEPKDGILFAGTSTGAGDPALTFHAGLTVY